MHKIVENKIFVINVLYSRVYKRRRGASNQGVGDRKNDLNLLRRGGLQ